MYIFLVFIYMYHFELQMTLLQPISMFVHLKYLFSEIS